MKHFRVLETQVEVWERETCRGNTEAAGDCFKAFFNSPKLSPKRIALFRAVTESLQGNKRSVKQIFVKIIDQNHRFEFSFP